VRLLLVVVACLLLASISCPVGLWLAGGSAAWLLLIPGLLLLFLLGLLQLGLWGSRGNLPALVRGQLDPEPVHLQHDISVQNAGKRQAYGVRIIVDLERTLAKLPARYLSFSVDLSQVVGGKWWNPEADAVEWGSGTLRAPVFDFNRPKLDLLAGALSPAYLRIGGSESDKAYYDLGAGLGRGPTIPRGYESAMTGAQWDAIQAFAARHDLGLVFTLNAGPATRDKRGRWQGDNAAELLAYTAERGYSVDVWELGNEVNIFFAVHGPSAQVTPGQYAQDLRVARALVDRFTPGARLAGQGSAYWPVLGEPLGALYGFMPGYLKGAGNVIDVVSWHYYPQQSRRGPMASRRAHPARLLDPANLDEAGHWATKINRWRDGCAPGRPVWLGETGNAQYGGEPGLSDVYLSGLWWLDQLGLMARLGQEVVVRQSLTGMDYGLLDEETLEPRPDYWHSLLWKRLMGPRVLPASARGDGADRLRVYAHTGAEAGAVTVLAINLDPAREALLDFPELEGRGHEVYAVTAPDLLGQVVLLNGEELALTGGALPVLRGKRRDEVRLEPLSYAFVRFDAG
jgi:heparanase 1